VTVPRVEPIVSGTSAAIGVSDASCSYRIGT